MKNIELASRVIQSLVDAGIEEFCLCAGARNSPFIILFDENPHLKAYHFFEERSAAFFALGRIAATRKPVVVITTSGTASAELLPAAVEGTYSSLPLIMITADRPKFYRKSGAPQTIDQVGLYSYYIEVAYDLDEENTHFSLKNLSWKKPVHVNVCFKEPLLDAPLPRIETPLEPLRLKFPESHPRTLIDEIENFLQVHRPLVLVSTLPPKRRGQIKEFLKKLGAPTYFEGISQLRGDPDVRDFSLVGSSKTLNEILDEKKCDAILRIGGVPTTRLWRDLEEKRKSFPVLSIGYNHFPGISREIRHFAALDVLDQVTLPSEKQSSSMCFKKDRARWEDLKSLFLEFPLAESSLVYQLSRHLNNKSVYLGNSLPIRDWDLAADYEISPSRVAGNRGANGIDGQISTFFGWCLPEEENWAIVGDLTALYDLSSPWIISQIAAQKIRLVVMNNFGGQIFDRMFKRSIFLNQHRLDFSSWAKMWNFEYVQWKNIPKDLSTLPDKILIEVNPDENQNQNFWKAYDDLR